MSLQVTMDAESASGGILDQDLLGQYRSRNNLLQRLINAYLQEAPALLQSILMSAENNNMDGLRSSAHTLKSSSHNLGAKRLSELCQEIETAAKAGDEAHVNDLVSRIGAQCFDVEQALRSELFALNPAN